MNRQIAKSAMQSMQIVPWESTAIARTTTGHSSFAQPAATRSGRPVRELVRPVWIALLSLLLAAGVGLGTAEILTYLFAESWNVTGLYGI
jgi:hypothetical protein